MELPRNILDTLSLVSREGRVLILSWCSAVVGHFEVGTGGEIFFLLPASADCGADSHSEDN